MTEVLLKGPERHMKWGESITGGIFIVFALVILSFINYLGMTTFSSMRSTSV